MSHLSLPKTSTCDHFNAGENRRKKIPVELSECWMFINSTIKIL